MRSLIHSLIVLCLAGACSPPPPSPLSANPALRQELASHLAPEFGANLDVEYELLREVPTQVGVAVPKYYLWLTASREQPVVAGAARVAAEGDSEFFITHFVSAAEIQSNPEQLSRIFPAALIPAIEARAALEVD